MNHPLAVRAAPKEDIKEKTSGEAAPSLNIVENFKKLDTTAKFVIVGGAALFLYTMFGSKPSADLSKQAIPSIKEKDVDVPPPPRPIVLPSLPVPVVATPSVVVHPLPAPAVATPSVPPAS